MKKSELKQIIKEEVHRVLSEGKQVGTLYHYTTLKNAIQILKDNALKRSTEPQEDEYGGERDGISFTRFSHTNILGSSDDRLSVRLKLDGDKLSNKYKILPYAQQEPETKRDKENWIAPFSRSTQDSESELVIPAKEYGGSIDILPYIKKIDIINPGDSQFSVSGNNFIKTSKEVEKLCNQLNIPVEFHNFKGYDDEGYWSPSKYTRALKSQFYDDKL
jgi:hypothetical protein